MREKEDFENSLTCLLEVQTLLRLLFEGLIRQKGGDHKQANWKGLSETEAPGAVLRIVAGYGLCPL